MGLIINTETSVTSYQFELRKIPDEQLQSLRCMHSHRCQ